MFRDKAHLPEYLTTIRYFDRLFAPGSQILDACAGTGRYSFYLAGQGHIVTACDLVERHVVAIKSRPGAEKLAGISVCDELDLPRFAEDSFIAVRYCAWAHCIICIQANGKKERYPNARACANRAAWSRFPIWRKEERLEFFRTHMTAFSFAPFLVK